MQALRNADCSRPTLGPRPTFFDLPTEIRIAIYQAHIDQVLPPPPDYYGQPYIETEIRATYHQSGELAAFTPRSWRHLPFIALCRLARNEFLECIAEHAILVFKAPTPGLIRRPPNVVDGAAHRLWFVDDVIVKHVRSCTFALVWEDGEFLQWCWDHPSVLLKSVRALFLALTGLERCGQMVDQGAPNLSHEIHAFTELFYRPGAVIAAREWTVRPEISAVAVLLNNTVIEECKLHPNIQVFRQQYGRWHKELRRRDEWTVSGCERADRITPQCKHRGADCALVQKRPIAQSAAWYEHDRLAPLEMMRPELRQTMNEWGRVNDLSAALASPFLVFPLRLQLQTVAYVQTLRRDFWLCTLDDLVLSAQSGGGLPPRRPTHDPTYDSREEVRLYDAAIRD